MRTPPRGLRLYGFQHRGGYAHFVHGEISVGRGRLFDHSSRRMVNRKKSSTMFTHPHFASVLVPVLALLGGAPTATAQSAYVRVSQVGYEAGSPSLRAYLMSSVSESGAIFSVLDSQGNAVYTASIGALLGTWSNSPTLTYNVYALDFAAPSGTGYTITVIGPAGAVSPRFPVASPDVLYPGLLLNTLFFYESERDGPDYIPNALRTAPGHLNDAHAAVYQTPPLDSNDNINTTGTPLTATGAVIDAAGGWWDAGDYMKYVETMSYTVTLQEIGIRDFPDQMGPGAPVNPPAPPDSISYAGSAA